MKGTREVGAEKLKRSSKTSGRERRLPVEKVRAENRAQLTNRIRDTKTSGMLRARVHSH